MAHMSKPNAEKEVLRMGKNQHAVPQLGTSNDNRWYIVPLCYRCNSQFGEHFMIEDLLVSVTGSKVVLW